MSKIKVLVVEDETIISKDIQQSLKSLGYGIAGSSATGKKAIELANLHQPDIVLMDIMLKGDMNGIEAAEIIKREQHIPVVFLTAYVDDATLEKAKVSQPYGYIVKPFKEVDLRTTIEIALYKHGKEKEVEKERDLLYTLVEGKDSAKFIFVKSNSRLVKLKNSDIYFIEALKDYVVINTADKRYTIHSTMKGIDEKLPNNEFIRVHRSFIVRLDKITTIEYPNLQLEDEKKLIPIGGSYKDSLIKKLNLV